MLIMKGFKAKEIEEMLGVPLNRLRYWDRSGFIQPSEGVRGNRRYSFRDLIRITTAKELMEAGLSALKVRHSLEELSKVLPETVDPLGTLKISALGDRLIVHSDEGLIDVDHSGQLILDFSVKELQGKIIEFQSEKRKPDSKELYLKARNQLDEPDKAEASLREVLELEPDSIDARNDLAVLLFHRGEVVLALDELLKVLEAEPEHPEALFNLGNLHAHQARWEESIKAYRKSLDASPGLADAHFNLAIVLRQQGHDDEARAHFRSYIRFDPEGEWAERAWMQIMQLENP